MINGFRSWRFINCSLSPEGPKALFIMFKNNYILFIIMVKDIFRKIIEKCFSVKNSNFIETIINFRTNNSDIYHFWLNIFT